MALALVPHHHLQRLPSDFGQHSPARRWPRTMDPSHQSRPQLPPISNLINAVTEAAENGHDPSLKYDHRRKASASSQGQPTSPDRATNQGSPRTHAPPPPPPSEVLALSNLGLPRPSPGNTSPNTGPAPPPHYYGPGPASGNHESYPPHHSSYPPIPEPNQWPTSQAGRLPIEAPVHNPSARPYLSGYPDLIMPDAPAYPASVAPPRPGPHHFPPPMQGPGLPAIDPQMAPTWQHHHYFPPTNPAAFPQHQERYVCPTCHKPFSRPSSLKIHTHSHTGEKPYKCKHDGCGKFFSVRSNMKRHEKGCHGGESASTSGASPKQHDEA